MDGYVTIGTDLDLSGIEHKLDQLSSMMEKKAVDAADNAASKSSKRFTAGFAIGVSALSSIMGKIMSKVSQAMGSAISRVDTLENFPRVMGTLGIDTNKAANAVNYLSEKLTGLPTTLDAGVSAVQRFTTKTLDVEVSTKMFLALNNALLASGSSMEKQQSALYMLSNAFSRGNMDLDAWYSAIEAMPAQMKQVADVMGYVSPDNLYAAMKKGEVSINDFMRTLVDMNEHAMGPYESLEEQARQGTKGIATSIANLKTAIVRGVADILATIGQENISNFFENIIKMIKAVIPYITAFVKTFVTGLNYIFLLLGKIGSFFGKLFGKKTKKDTDKTKTSYDGVGAAIGGVGDSAKKATGSAKKLKKELGNLQGFDEMNVLQDNSDTGSSGGGAGGVGGLDAGGLGALGDLGGLDILDKIGKKLKDATLFTDLFTAAVWGLIGAFAAWKLGTFLKDIGAFPKILGEMSKADILTKAIGIGAIISGLVIGIKGVIDYLKDPTWENFAKILAGIALIVAGLALVFNGTVAIIAGIVLVVAAVGVAIYKNWDKIKAVLSKVGDWIKTKVIDPVVNFFKGLWEAIKAIFSPVIEFYKNIFTTIITNIKTMISNITQVLTALWTGIKAIFGPVFQWIYDKIIKPISDKFTALWTGIKNGVTSAVDKVKSVFSGVINFFKNIVNSIVSVFTTIGSKVGNAIGKAFKGAINVVLSVIENVLNTPIRAINSLISVINALPGVKLKSLSTFKLPRLAKGGIINQPGRGVMVGSAIAGERGAEGVIPLTDSQQMSLLGEAIGRYITVNANITNTMNGRVISRELQKVQNESDFAFNR